MVLKEDCYCLGYITRLHGYKGEVSISFDVDEPSEYKELESVFVEIDGKLIPFFLEELRFQKKKTAVARFEDIDSEEKAKILLKRSLYLPLDILPENTNSESDPFAIEGFSVIDDKHGPIGFVESIIDIQSNPIIQIRLDETEILLPRQDEFITSVDRKNKTVHISAPEGLIDMYLGKGEA